MTETTPRHDAAAFLAEEREAWRAYEALMRLSDAQLDRPADGAHGWSGRDLVAHLVGWHDVTVSVARGLAAGDATILDAYYGISDETVDKMNADTIATWRRLPLHEVRRRFIEIPETLRAALRSAPEAWLDDERGYQWMLWNTLEHYEGHAADLAAILEPQ